MIARIYARVEPLTATSCEHSAGVGLCMSTIRGKQCPGRVRVVTDFNGGTVEACNVCGYRGRVRPESVEANPHELKQGKQLAQRSRNPTLLGKCKDCGEELPRATLRTQRGRCAKHYTENQRVYNRAYRERMRGVV